MMVFTQNKFKMNKEYVFEKVKLIIEKIMEGASIPDVEMNSNMRNDLEMDSLNLIELILACEHDFNIMVNDDDVVGFTTVEECVNYIHKLINK